MSVLDQDKLKRVLSSPHGRQIIWEIMGIGGVLKQPFSADARLSDFNCGSLNVGIVIWSECMEASPDLTAMMIKEQGNGRPADDNGTADSDNDARARKRVKPSDHDTSINNNGDYLNLGFDRSGRNE